MTEAIKRDEEAKLKEAAELYCDAMTFFIPAIECKSALNQLSKKLKLVPNTQNGYTFASICSVKGWYLNLPLYCKLTMNKQTLTSHELFTWVFISKLFAFIIINQSHYNSLKPL